MIANIITNIFLEKLQSVLMHQWIVSIASDPSEPSISAVSKDVMAEEGISVPTILLPSRSFSRTT